MHALDAENMTELINYKVTFLEARGEDTWFVVIPLM